MIGGLGCSRQGGSWFLKRLQEGRWEALTQIDQKVTNNLLRTGTLRGWDKPNKRWARSIVGFTMANIRTINDYKL
jgi:hypothetical protein